MIKAHLGVEQLEPGRGFLAEAQRMRTGELGNGLSVERGQHVGRTEVIAECLGQTK